MDILIMPLKKNEEPINFSFQFLNKKMALRTSEITMASHKMVQWIIQSL